MNRRYLAVIAVLIAVPLFAGPLVSPVPDYGPHIEISADKVNFSSEEEKEEGIRNETTIDYQNLSNSGQQLFDKADKRGWSSDTMVRFDEAPKSWTTNFSQGFKAETNVIYVHKNGQYYHVNLHRFIPSPSFKAFMLRLGPLLGAIGLGTLAGYFVLTAED
ncbi:hypothetical protein [Halocatena marina]|uniref:DUF7979 domain-containing protein n=2 Tax=Halocatena marina TaxID=2934937 RepID=A0ABD5YW55_9EURY|nr:hypothetical protein [Halocatena marina]